MKNKVLLRITTFFLGWFLLASSACKNENHWTLSIYPSGIGTVDETSRIGAFSSLEACRAAALGKIEAMKWTNAEYECGLNCKKWFEDVPDSPLVCEETLGDGALSEGFKKGL